MTRASFSSAMRQLVRVFSAKHRSQLRLEREQIANTVAQVLWCVALELQARDSLVGGPTLEERAQRLSASAEYAAHLLLDSGQRSARLFAPRVS